MKRIITIFLLLFIVFATVPVGAAWAGTLTDRIIKNGEEVNEDVEVYGGNLTIEEGAIVNGDVAVFGGHAEIGGSINGDVAVFGGDVDLTGVIDGDLVVFGGNMEVFTQAEVGGECALLGGSITGDGQDNVACTTFGENFSFPFAESMGIPAIPPIPDVPDVPDIPAPHIEAPHTSFVGRFFGTVGQIAGNSLALGLLALIVAVLIPTQLNQVSDVVIRKPVASGTVGILTSMAGPFAIAILALISGLLIILCGLGLLGFPIVLVLSIALAFGLLMGWVAVGTLLGQRLAEVMKLTNRSLPVVAALGTVALTLVMSAMIKLPFFGWMWFIVAFVIASAGLGAVTLTKFGTRDYPLEPVVNAEKVAAVLETLPVEDTDDTVEAADEVEETEEE
ncbi:MAG: polymer-forming cytoskeletal protein [Candidatus Promineifilaceae bacterium]